MKSCRCSIPPRLSSNNTPVCLRYDQLKEPQHHEVLGSMQHEGPCRPVHHYPGEEHHGGYDYHCQEEVVGAAHVSHHVICQDNVLNVDQQHNKAELEGQAYKMSWDWDATDINPDKDDGYMWVPITPKTVEEE